MMSITYYTKQEYKLIIIVHSEKVTDDEFLSFYKALYNSRNFDPSVNMLVDLRETNSIQRSSDVLRMFADFAKRRLDGLSTRPKIAVVAPKDLSFGLARMCEAFAASVPWDFSVFRAMDAALAKLGVPEDLMDTLDQDRTQQPVP